MSNRFSGSDLPPDLTTEKWAVISVKEVIAKDLGYVDAYDLMQEKSKETSLGVAIVANRVAERLLHVDERNPD